MINEYQQKYLKQIYLTVNKFNSAEKLSEIIDKIYSDGFEDGTNEGRPKRKQ